MIGGDNLDDAFFASVISLSSGNFPDAVVGGEDFVCIQGWVG